MYAVGLVPVILSYSSEVKVEAAKKILSTVVAFVQSSIASATFEF